MNLERLNINFGGKPLSGLRDGDALLRELAGAVGEELPPSYLAFLRYSDGGHPEIGSFRPQGGAAENLFDVDWFYSLSAAMKHNLQQALKDWGAVLGKGALPIARDGGGNQIYIDLCEASSVWLYLPDEGGKRLRLADSFEQFVDRLESNPDFV